MGIKRLEKAVYKTEIIFRKSNSKSFKMWLILNFRIYSIPVMRVVYCPINGRAFLNEDAVYKNRKHAIVHIV